jgi:hypothetical protein
MIQGIAGAHVIIIFEEKRTDREYPSPCFLMTFLEKIHTFLKI